MIDVSIKVPSAASTKDRLARGYRARRNYLVYEFLSMVVEQTPVKTGLARGSWQLGIGSKPTGNPGRLDPNGDQTVYEEIGKLKGASPFANVFVGSNLDYMRELEEGSSGQAPEGILRVVVPAFRSMHGESI